jgi:hypothetical protein
VNPTRRQLLGGGIGALASYALVACDGGNTARHPSGSAGTTAPGTTAPGQTGPVTRTAQITAAITNEQQLLGTYEAALARHPGLASALALPRAHHRAHLLALGAQPDPGPAVASIPADPAAAIRVLVGLEGAAAGQRQAGAVADVRNGSLLASIAGAESVHTDLLTTALASVSAGA